MRSMEVFILFLILLVSFTVGESCTKNCRREDSLHLWYVWLILIFICVLFACGFIASCVKVCCRPNKPPVPTFESHPFEVTVISMDNQSTIHSISTVSSFAVSRPPQSGHPPHPFAAVVSSSYSPPPYSLYARESPPQYDEALAMPADAGGLGAGISGNTEDHGECHHMCVSGEQPTEFTEEPLQRENLQYSQDNAAMDEEEPPAYQLYNNIAEEELSEIDLDEIDPTQSHKEDTSTLNENV